MDKSVAARVLVVGALCAQLASAQFTWTLESPSTIPPERYRHAAAFDSSRGVVVIFGGQSFANPGGWFERNDTWEWSGSDWSPRVAASSPPAMVGPRMAFDSWRNVCVLVGGDPVQTWEWNGTDWALRATTPGLPQSDPASPSSNPALVFDSVRGVTVLVGKVAGASASQTWEWDGSLWSQKVSAISPPLQGFSGAFDEARAKTVVVNSVGLWEWDGVAWQQFPGPPCDPCAASIIGVANYVPSLFQTVYTNYALREFAWDGANWTSMPTSACGSCSPAYIGTSIVQAGDETAVLFGGSALSLPFDETFTRNVGLFEQPAAASYGQGCGNPTPEFSVVPGSSAMVGTTLSTLVAPVHLGFAWTAWGAVGPAGMPSLPLDLDFLGFEGCELWHSADLALDSPCIATSFTTAQHDFPLPLDHALVGVHLFGQAWTFQPGFNTIGLVLSNALDITIGNIE